MAQKSRRNWHQESAVSCKTRCGTVGRNSSQVGGRVGGGGGTSWKFRIKLSQQSSPTLGLIGCTHSDICRLSHQWIHVRLNCNKVLRKLGEETVIYYLQIARDLLLGVKRLFAFFIPKFKWKKQPRPSYLTCFKCNLLQLRRCIIILQIMCLNL